jgi:hypothetical protein
MFIHIKYYKNQMSALGKRKHEEDDINSSKCLRRAWFAFRFNQSATGKEETDKDIILQEQTKIANIQDKILILKSSLDIDFKDQIARLEEKIVNIKSRIDLIKSPISFEAFKVLQERSQVDYFEFFQDYFVRIFYEPDAVIQELIVGETHDDADTIRNKVHEIAARFKRWDDTFALSTQVVNPPSVAKVIKTIQKMNW